MTEDATTPSGRKRWSRWPGVKVKRGRAGYLWLSTLEAGREKAATMWFETYGMYMHHMMGGEGGTDEQLLEYSS